MHSSVGDAEIVEWIGRLGAAGAEHVAVRFAMTRALARERLENLQREGLLEAAALGARRRLYWASTAGLGQCDLQRLGYWPHKPQGLDHAWQIAQVAVELQVGLPDWEVLSAREVAAIEAGSGEQFASVLVGPLSTVHLPALVLCSPRTRVVPVEVQPPLGGEFPLVSICRAWRNARHVSRVYWLANFGPDRSVRRAINETHASDQMTVLGLDDVALLIASEAAREEAVDVLL